MDEYRGKKIQPVTIEIIQLDNSPIIFHKGRYIGFCNLDGLPHGFGELTSAEYKDVKCNGEWEDGVFIKGTYIGGANIIYEGSFQYDDNIGSGDWELHGQGIELHFGNLQNYEKNKPIGHVKGLFNHGSLIEGEILHPSLINYSDHKGIKKIIYLKPNIKEVFDKQFKANIKLTLGEIFYDDGAHYKGEIDFDLPYGLGTMILADGKKITSNWINGNVVE
jgi:hypothetical protein